MNPFAQMPAQPLPELPPGPSLDRVRGPVEIAPFEAWQIGLIILVSVIGLFIVVAIAWTLLRRRRNRSEVIPPRDAAIAEVEAAKLADSDTQFASLISTAIRRYLETGLNLQNQSKTTEEFLRTAKLHSEDREVLDHFLNTCDEAKFARKELSDSIRIELLDTAQKVIDSFRNLESPALDLKDKKKEAG